MKQIILSNMSKHEAYELDRRLAYCAEKAFQEAREDLRNNESDVDISKNYIYALASCYLDSLFCSDDDTHVEHVKKRLEIELNRYYPSSDIIRQELLIPIMGYALLVSNEYNEEAVRKRVRTDSKRPTPKKGDEYPYNQWKHLDPYTITRSENPPKSSSFQRKFYALKDEIVTSGVNNDNLTYHVLYAYGLIRNYRGTAKCQDIARIALFLRRILTDFCYEDWPIDNLIHMYLANHLDNIFFRSYQLCDEARHGAISREKQSNHLLSFFWDNTSEYEENDSESYLEFSDEYSNWSFTEIYRNIIENYTISPEDLNELINFYMDGEALFAYAYFQDDIRQYADDVIENMKNRVAIPKNSLTPTMMKFVLQRIHRIKSDKKLRLCHISNGQWRGDRIKRKLTLSVIYPSRRENDCVEESDRM